MNVIKTTKLPNDQDKRRQITFATQMLQPNCQFSISSSHSTAKVIRLADNCPTAAPTPELKIVRTWLLVGLQSNSRQIVAISVDKGNEPPSFS
jgi:hypothetical protein